MSEVAPEAEAKAASAAARGRKPLRIAIMGGYGIGNFGNDASFEAAYAYLRETYPDADIASICTNPPLVTERYGVRTYPIMRKPRGPIRRLDTLLLRLPSLIASWIDCLFLLPKFDLIVVAGTGTFDDYGDTPFGWPSRLVRWSVAARLRGIRMAYLSVGAGPIYNPISRVLMKLGAEMGQLRSYRDEDSLRYMQSIGVDESASYALPDLAFLLPAPPNTQPRTPGAKLTVGVGIMNYFGWFHGLMNFGRASRRQAIHREYMDKHARFIEWLEAQGHKVRILVGQDSDWRAVREMEAKLGRSLTEPGAEERLRSFHDAMRACAETDIVVTSRYHVQIAALQVGRPVISLSYAPKSDSLLADAGLGDLTQDIHHIDLDRLASQINGIALNYARYSDIVRERVAAMRRRLRETLPKLDLIGG